MKVRIGMWPLQIRTRTATVLACEHEVVPHGDHVDALVDGLLQHPHADYCDDHGPVTVYILGL